MLVKSDTGKIEFVARQMGINSRRAAELTGFAQEMIDEVLAGGWHTETPAEQAALAAQRKQVDLRKIAANLQQDIGHFSTWTEDGMVWILFGKNLVEGIAGSGRDCAEATASFYENWYYHL